MELPDLRALDAWSRSWAQRLREGGVVTVTGPLGAGKTTLIASLVSCLGSPERVTSPTYTLVHVYQGPLPIVHMDLYRLGEPEEFLELEEAYLRQPCLAFIEWPEKAEPYLPPPRWRLRLDFGPRGRLLEVFP